MFSDADDDASLQFRKDQLHKAIEKNGDGDLSIHALADGELSTEDERRLMARILVSPILMDKLDSILKQNRIIRENYTAFIKKNSH